MKERESKQARKKYKIYMPESKRTPGRLMVQLRHVLEGRMQFLRLRLAALSRVCSIQEQRVLQSKTPTS